MMRPNNKNSNEVFGFHISRIVECSYASPVKLISFDELRKSINTSSGQQDKDSALKLACYADHIESIEYLLSIGANPVNNQDINNYYSEENKMRKEIECTPVYIIRMVGSSEALDLLLKACAKPLDDHTKSNVDKQPASKVNPLFNFPTVEQAIDFFET